jgi:murein DD-endopeptidase MepM/ murein hydrolase activator NlpD
MADWAEGPVSSALRIATYRLLGTRSFEPYFIYKGPQAEPNDAGERYLELINRVAGYPGPSVVQAAMRQARDEETPVVISLVPPVEDYFDPKRKSFGVYIGDEHGGPFEGSHHVGDDVSFGHQHETVVAIGDGIVRYALVGALSWGGIVVIEHHDRKTDKKFCSLYSHLGPLLCVKAGDRVRQGDMLGSLGRDNTMATGGYVSHLHFGIHLTGFSGNWITGYLSPQQFEADHSWIDPQPFIRERMK